MTSIEHWFNPLKRVVFLIGYSIANGKISINRYVRYAFLTLMIPYSGSDI